MIEKINKVIELQKELDYEYGIIEIDLTTKNEKTVLLRGLNEFLNLANEPIEETVLKTDNNFYRLTTNIYGVDFIVIITTKEYQEYKKATAPTVTKESDTL